MGIIYLIFNLEKNLYQSTSLRMVQKSQENHMQNSKNINMYLPAILEEIFYQKLCLQF